MKENNKQNILAYWVVIFLNVPSDRIDITDINIFNINFMNKTPMYLC